MPELITAELVALDAQFGDSKDDVIKALARLVAASGRSDDADGLADDAFAREAKSSTGMPGGLAIPHCRSEHVSEPTLVFARLSPGVDFGSKDGPADLTFMIAAPATGDQEHMRLLTKLARALVRKEFTSALRSATTNEEIVDLVSGVVNDQPAAKTEPEAVTTTATGDSGSDGGATAAAPVSSAPVTAGAPSSTTQASTTSSGTATPSRGDLTIVAVTACPTGIAHTYMAAEALEAAGKKAGVNLVVEPQGSVGAETIDPSIIASASAAIFATDVGVRNRERFAGLPEISTGVKNGIHEADDLVARAIAAASDPNAKRVSGTPSASSGAGGGRPQMTGGLGTRLRTALLTGVSYMIPFVAAGGLLIALGFLLGGYEVALAYTKNGFTGGNLSEYVLANYKITHLPPGSLSPHALGHSGLLLYLGVVLFKIGGLAFSFLIPALAGYIAFAIADRPGIAPGFTAGAIASLTGAGFIGGIIGGLLAGVVALWFAGLSVPRFVRGLMPVVIIPLCATIITGLLMYIVLSKPLAWITTELGKGLNNMSGSSAVLLGIILGLMMCFDLGGPVNKAAYLFATAGLAANNTASFRIMAAVMLCGMVPPLALALATTLRPGLFTEPELENGRAAWLLGASFISEGAIPFAAADPFRVIPPVMVGGAVTGALSELFHVGLHAPHGGIFVLFAVDNKLSFLIALVAGTVVAAILVIVMKGLRGDDVAAEAAEGQLVNA